MENSITKIQLIGEVEGYLDVAENVTVPINYGIGDVRDLGKRTGTFSKTIILPGTKNNNRLLNSYYDVNIAAGTFNINKLQKCLLLQNNIPIISNAYLQLVAVNKLQNTINEDDLVEYEVVIKDNVGDFFTKLGNRTLDGKDEGGISYLDFSEFDHILTAGNVSESFDNTWENGYKYLIPWVDNNVLSISECKPAIYAKQYWDKIHASTGFTYTWATISSSNVQFDKLVIPYNGDDKKLTEESVNALTTTIKRGVLGNLTSNVENTVVGGGASVGERLFKDYNVIIDQGRMDTTTTQGLISNWIQNGGLYVGPGFYLNPSDLLSAQGGITVTVTGEYRFSVINSSPIMDVGLSNPNADTINGVGSKPFISLTKTPPNGTPTQYRIAIDNPVLFPDQVYPASTTITTVPTRQFSASIFISNVEAGSTFTIGSGIQFNYNGLNEGVRFTDINISTTYPDMRCVLDISNLAARFSPQANTLLYNFPVSLNTFIPKQIKQADFIKSICLMYNLFVETDPNNDTNLIYRHRDDFYDQGRSRDWTKKLDRSKEQKINFLPELSSKKLLLTYKASEDAWNKLYFGSTAEVYGQQEIIFQNEYVRGEDKKELIFSPTPSQPSGFNAICPLIPGISPKTNIRILLDNGPRECGQYTIVNTPGNGVNVPPNQLSLVKYPLLSHLDSDYNPTFDINFGICDFYFYNIEYFTSNNLFNNFWRRTVSQIDQGKLLTAYFMLDESDMSNIKLNDKIRIDNSWWNINRIIDYNANAKIPTKVELMSIDDSLQLPRVVKKGVVRFNRPADTYIKPTPGTIGVDPITPNSTFPGIQSVNSDASTTRYEELSGWSNGGTGIIIGINNQLPSGFNGIVIGSNGIIPSQPGVYVGGYALTADGLIQVPNSIGISGVIDCGRDIVLPYSKTNEADIIDAGQDVVRLFGGGCAGGFIIDARDTSPPIIPA